MLSLRHLTFTKEIVLMSLYRQFIFSVFASFVVIPFSSSAFAVVVGAQAAGHHLAGGTITVFFAQQGPQVAPILAGGIGTGLASLPALFDFSVTGDTFLADWKLTNLTTFDIINRVEFDLSTSISLFDDGTSPDTDFGYAGRAGAVQVNAGAPFIIASGEGNLWPDLDNEGDEYLAEFIGYSNFGPGMTSLWRDDTDIIGIQTPPEAPEPGTLALVLFAGMGLLLNRSKS
jgi:hypothetical protein